MRGMEFPVPVVSCNANSRKPWRERSSPTCAGVGCCPRMNAGGNIAQTGGWFLTMHTLWMGAYHALLMGWETFWALVLGFAVSGALQVFVGKDRMSRFFGRADLRSVGLAMGFGAASSSCSYAAAAAARSAFRQGAALVPAMAFMFASTNLVIELGAVLWLLMGWRFVLAEVVGAFVLVALVWGMIQLFFPAGLEQEARAHAGGEANDGHCCHHDGAGHEGDRWTRLAGAFVMDWQMLWKEIVGGCLVAGYLMALVPMDGWRALFLQDGPGWLRLVENAVVGPLIAVASFVCSVGNIPLASVLWSGGISFGGVISFIYADLLIVPLILIYRKYYGGRTAVYLTVIFFLAMAGAGIVVDLLFGALRLVPAGPRPPSVMERAHFAWNYTTWLDLVALAVATVLWWQHARARRSTFLRGCGHA